MKLVRKTCTIFNKQPMPIKILLVLAVVSILCCLTSCGVFAIESFKNPATSVYYFHMDGCPHCVKFDQHWETLIKEKDMKSVKFEKIERKDLKNDQKKMVQGFPTIIKYDANGDHDEFQGDRNVAALKKWINE